MHVIMIWHSYDCHKIDHEYSKNKLKLEYKQLFYGEC